MPHTPSLQPYVALDADLLTPQSIEACWGAEASTCSASPKASSGLTASGLASSTHCTAHDSSCLPSAPTDSPISSLAKPRASSATAKSSSVSDSPAQSQKNHSDTPHALNSEDACLNLIDSLFPSKAGHNPAGRGDDCAILTMPSQLALSTDTFFEDSHFRTRYFSPREVGAKALASAVSDLGAAGAIPLGFSLNLMMPASMPADTLRQLLEGMAHVAEHHGILLTGGDIAKTPKLGLCVTVWGKSVSPQETFFFSRGAAQPEDCIFCVGELGLAKAGLLFLEKNGRYALKQFPHACQSHLWPKALTHEGAALARFALRHPASAIGLMDVSDGLAQDIPRLLGMNKSGREHLGADLRFTPDVIPQELHLAAKELSCSPESLMLSGGEDYALLGTCPAHLWKDLQTNLPSAYAIGKVTTQGSLSYQGTPLAVSGFDHFKEPAI